jgi:starch synthase
LRDTVVDVAQDKRRANGFAFETYTAEDMVGAMARAVTLYRDDPRAWRDIQQRGMEQDLSWQGSAKTYRSLYRKLVR